MALLEASGIGKNFEETHVLKDISLTLEKGEALAIIGSSGSGKTTLLRCLNFLERPDTGVIKVNGETMWDAADPATQKESEIRKKRLHFGLVFQNFNLFPQYTALQNVMLAGELLAKEQPDYKANKKAIHAQLEAQARDLLAQMGLSERAGHYPHQLSGGQQQRVALARILCSKPEAILLDEPFSALDSFLKWNLELELSDLLSDFQNPILWVSHDLGECYRNCQTVCVMENGRSGAVLDMKELAHHPTMQGAARLTSCRNFLPARACAGGMELEGWNIVLPLEAPAQRVTVAIPDEAVAIGIGPHEARVLRVISDLNSTVLLLRPAGTADAPLLRAVAPKDAQVRPGRTVHFSLQTDKCLCYNT